MAQPNHADLSKKEEIFVFDTKIKDSSNVNCNSIVNSNTDRNRNNDFKVDTTVSVNFLIQADT